MQQVSFLSEENRMPLTQETTNEEIDNLVDRINTSPAERTRVLHRLLGETTCRQLGIYPIPDGFKISVVIPVYNELKWIREVVRRVQAVSVPKEIILVDDWSTDGTREILSEMEGDGVRVFFQPRNQGKGAA